MGTDAVTVAEVFDPVENCWKAEFGELVENPDYPDSWERWLPPYSVRGKEESGRRLSEDELNGRYGFSRNYEIFAVLAGVRNGEDYPVMARPRGVPRNADKVTKVLARQDRMGRAPHSYSRLTLAEMQAFDWEQEIAWFDSCKRGLVYGPIRALPALARLHEVMRRMAELGEPDKVRLVFWFNG